MSIVARNKVTTYGTGKQTMVFAHGFGCDQHMWRFVAPAFSSRYKLVLFDHVGAGQSDTSAYDFERYNSLTGYRDDVLELLRELDLTDVVYVGHSVSAMIGVLAAIEEPDRFGKLVLVGASPCYINDAAYTGGFEQAEIDELLVSLETNFRQWSSSMAPVIMSNHDRPELAEELINSFGRLKPDIAKQFARVTFLSDCRQYLPQVHVPSMVLQSAEDFVAPVNVGEYLHAHLPNSAMAVIDTSGHYPHLSAPVATIAAMDRFLRTTPVACPASYSDAQA